eukprot:COSAG05_NODE_12478_length_466_cov_0.970027_1_plen_99_part_10
MNAAGDVSFAQKALVKSGESDDASSGAALDSGAPQDAAAAEAETTEPEPEKPAIYKYKPKLHMQDRDGNPSTTRQARNFEFQEELFPELGAEAPKSTGG